MSNKLQKDMQLVISDTPATTSNYAGVVPAMSVKESSALVEYTKTKTVKLREDEEDLEVKLRRIIENVPVKVSNTSGSSAGSGSGDFHQYRQMRRKEQDRVTRMEADYARRLEVAEFELRRQERLNAAEERTSKKRMKRQKKKQKKKEKKAKTSGAENEVFDKGGEDDRKEDESSQSDDSGNDDELKC